MHKKATEEFYAKFNLYESMAHYVAKVLHKRPNDILDNWGVPELIVAFGEYANEQSRQNYEDWKSLDPKSKTKIPKPSEYIVYFQDIEEEE